MSKRGFILMVIGIFALGMFAGVAISCAVYMGSAEAEDGFVYRCWAMCRPGSEVMIREKPNKRAAVVGAVSAGRQMWTDWQEKNGWLHLVDVSSEAGEGWIYEGYVVFTEPREIGGEMRIRANGRVACRSWIGGKRTGWARNGEAVKVYWIADDIAMTDRGFILSEYLEGR